MIGALGGKVPAAPGTPDAKDAKMRDTARQLEGVFVQQMYKAMRETVPTDGPFHGGSGEDMFTGMLDERAAADTPAHWQHGLSEAIYRHLREAQNKAQGGSMPASEAPSPVSLPVPTSLPVAIALPTSSSTE